ncbi:MAG: class I SAM-dependent methyltransferase [Actinomycetota bacterium]|nr:class I SAM-dependent methyltransferase [Actinomycetota bacterium]
MADSARDYWDTQAATFDDAADHGLRDRDVRRAWRDLLLPFLPPAPATVVDLGCGTGSLSVLLAQVGYDVRGVDLSARMVEAAIAKAAAAGVVARFEQADASDPPFQAGSCDVVLARHVVWALPDPDAAMSRWADLLRPNGRLILVEGSWSTGAGLTADACEALVLRHRAAATVRHLQEPLLWGGPIDDDRYLIVSTH